MRANLSAVAPLTEFAAAEISRPAEKLVFFENLKPTYGIPYGRVYLYRLMRDGRFPLRVKVAARGRSAWIESEIIDWIRSLPRAITIRPDATTKRTGRRGTRK